MIAPEDTDLDLELPADPGSVGVARRAVAEVARWVGARENDVKLAVSEALTAVTVD